MPHIHVSVSAGRWSVFAMTVNEIYAQAGGEAILHLYPVWRPVPDQTSNMLRSCLLYTSDAADE